MADHERTEPSETASASDTDQSATPDGGRNRLSEAEQEAVRDHRGIIDIERLPGGHHLTQIRTDLVNRYAGYLTLEKSDKEEVTRWGWGSIISHWLLVALMAIAIITGVAFWTGWYGPLDIGIWDGYQTAFYLHIFAGILIAVIALVIFPFYHKVADGHKLLVTPRQIKEEIVIALSFIGLMRYIPGYKQARRAYDEEEGEWVAYHPMQTVFWYVTWFFVVVLTLTGFALWKAISTDPAWWVAALGFMEGWVTYETMLQLHLIATFWVIAAIIVHAYFPLMRGNWDVTKSMVYGTMQAWRITDENRPEELDVAADEQPEEEANND